MTTSPPIYVDLQSTQDRISNLRRYVEENLLREGEFICPHLNSCQTSIRPGDGFREGTMSHVGHRFDLRVGDKPLRVVVVGQESGLPKDTPELAQKVTLDARYGQVYHGSGMQSRYYAAGGHTPRNPHMRGTTSALRVLFGMGLGSDYDGEWIHPANGDPFHIFDGFALVNRLLCSAGPVGTSSGRPSKTMLTNCRDHFAETLAILQPTILIFQGDKATANWPNDLKRGRTLRPGYPPLVEAHLGDQRIVVCEFSHPSAHGWQRWGANLDAHYLTNLLEPTLQEALQFS
ncbi:hypothetical protein MJO55_23600 [Mycolicibacterium rufum]|uniref:Uracil DNA glycosylase superfamily protein n=1 Tax=Mycolicibacterium rufum TaxID=318424 RepID=A0A9X2Y9T5_9MYCO|nr:hypothetical protein [Mycolicibacterium rufum]KGI69919.1 hypothetical protein EU78_23530 [Mycolicibacterium rufum]MCV7069440.1 hypothetical protein [Mycolicibacterium rufum]ULP36171.1 hypothetical protein MJO55_23600 [Mycolicibacterium rufum]